MTTATQHTKSMLAGASAVMALVGARYWPDVADDSLGAPALPYITYQIISEIRNDHLSGPGKGKRCRAQINCWAATRNGADALADAVEIAASNAKGRIVFRNSDHDEDAQIYRAQLDWSFPIRSP